MEVIDFDVHDFSCRCISPVAIIYVSHLLLGVILCLCMVWIFGCMCEIGISVVIHGEDIHGDFWWLISAWHFLPCSFLTQAKYISKSSWLYGRELHAHHYALKLINWLIYLASLRNLADIISYCLSCISIELITPQYQHKCSRRNLYPPFYHCQVLV